MALLAEAYVMIIKGATLAKRISHHPYLLCVDARLFMLVSEEGCALPRTFLLGSIAFMFDSSASCHPMRRGQVGHDRQCVEIRLSRLLLLLFLLTAYHSLIRPLI